MVAMGGYASVLALAMFGIIIIACFVSAIVARRSEKGNVGIFLGTVSGSILAIASFYAVAASLGN